MEVYECPLQVVAMYICKVAARRSPNSLDKRLEAKAQGFSISSPIFTKISMYE